MPRKLVAIAVSATIALGGTAAAQAMTAVRASTPRQADLFAPKVPFTRLATVNGTTAQAVATARSADGNLHLVFQTRSGNSLNGLSTVSISPAGKAGPQISALSGWQAGQPALVLLPGGTLEAVFGAISPSNVSSLWGITSNDGGATWSAPAVVKGGGPLESLVYGSDVTAALSSGTPVLALPQAGQLVIQRGLGAGSPSYQLTNSADGSTTDAEVATDAASGEVVAGWPSIAGNPKLYLQGASPSTGTLQAVPGQSRNVEELAGRDAGPGVYGAYTPDGKHVRLLRYGGGSVAVGSAKTQPKVLGVATSLDGRLWVMWGDDSGGGVAVTRSNKAITRFEPIQHLKPNSGSIYRISGDGRLGTLDLLVDQIPNAKGPIQPPGLFYGRTRPVLSAAFSVKPIKNTKLAVIGHTLKVTVSDAGDPVSGATVSVGTKVSKTSANGVAHFVFGSNVKGKLKVTITAPGYWPLKTPVTL
jgi:hypothetical protein